MSFLLRPDGAMTIGIRLVGGAAILLLGSWSAISFLSSMGCAARSRGVSTPVDAARAVRDPALDARLTALRARLDELARPTFEFWHVHGPDRAHGGFHGTLDRHGNPIAPTDKSLIQTVRHLWAMSMWYERKQAAPDVKALADGLYAFLMSSFRDAADDQFYLTVSETGAPVDRQKLLAGQALAIYALTEYARVFHHAAAGAQALATFHALDGLHDARFGGYIQLAPDMRKETVAQVHLLEAFTALDSYSHDSTVRARLEEMAAVVADRLLQKGGSLDRAFLPDWTPIGTPAVNYGHDMESGWLLLEAARALGRPADPKLVGAAKTMILGAARTGYDAAKGGYFEEGPPGGAPAKLDKVWWAQAEALLGLWRAYELTGDVTLLDRLDGTLRFVETALADPVDGEWFWSLRPDGGFGEKGDIKGSAWKASYHTLRALVFTEGWIAAAQQVPATAP